MTVDTVHISPTVDVAFITVNYNTRGLLEELVTFFRKAALPFSHTLVVVDNASSDGSLEFLATCRDVTSIANDENIGYGRAMNRGIAASQSRYLCLMNTDVILTAGSLTALFEHCRNHTEVQVCTPVIRYSDGRIQGFFFKFGLPTLYLELYKKLWNKRFKKQLVTAIEAVRVDGVAGAFIFCDRKLALDGKLFDEDFFFYYEDTELAHRLFKQGIRCEVLPQQSIIHIGGQSSSIRHIRLFYGSRYRYIAKQYGSRHARCIFWQDRLRVGIKLMFYRCAALITSNEKILYKRESYTHVAQVLHEIGQNGGINPAAGTRP